MIDAFHGERASRVVSKAQSSRTVHRPEDSMFLEQMANDRLLVSIDPAREQQRQKASGGGSGFMARGCLTGVPLFNRSETWTSCAVTPG